MIFVPKRGAGDRPPPAVPRQAWPVATACDTTPGRAGNRILQLLFLLLHQLQRFLEVDLGVEVVRLRVERSSVRIHGLGKLAHLEEGVAEVVQALVAQPRIFALRRSAEALHGIFVLLRAVKRALDPDGLFNPGALLPREEDRD